MRRAAGNSWLRHRSLAIGGGLAALLLLTALASLIWTPHPATELDVAAKLQGPTPAHWLGTDHFGRDVLTLLMVGTQNSVIVGLVAVGLGLTVGVLLGGLAAARGGWLDEALMRVCDFTFAFPAVLSAILLTVLLGPGAVNAILAIGIFNIPVFARVTRGAARQIWSRDFVTAAQAVGKTPLRITVDHVLPNIAGVVIVQATIQFGLAILAEAGLSYLGLGTQPPNPSWGRMLNDAQTFMYLAPGLAIYPGLAITAAVLGLNLFGDGLRDLMDPRYRRLL